MKTYIKKMKERLEDHQISQDLLDEIIEDYRQRLENNDSSLLPVEEEVENIIKKYDLKLIEHTEKDITTIIAFVPFVSIVSYLVLGFGFDFWHPGWLVFILIPILVMLFSVFHDDIISGILALIPFFIIFTYFFIGFYFHIWHPTWLVFILLPVIGIFSHHRRKNIKFLLFSLSPFITITLYIILGIYGHMWNRAWVLFLLVPMLACLEETNKKRLLICVLSLFLAMVLGFIIPYITDDWGLSFLVLLIPSFVFLSLGENSVIRFSKDTTMDWLLFLFLATSYLLLGIFMDGWAYGWMLIMILPIYEIVKQSTEHFKFYYIMPFISIAIFFTLGYFFNLWLIGLSAFILIFISYLIERD